jgi:CheY-like chemotaxis protein
VIDDLLLVREPVAWLLRREGFEVAEAAGGAEGIRLLCETHVDLVLTDLRMPGCSRWDVARAARQFCPNLPVVLLTGSPEVAEAAPALRGLVRAVIPKPVSPESLLRVVRAVAGSLDVEKRSREASC